MTKFLPTSLCLSIVAALAVASLLYQTSHVQGEPKEKETQRVFEIRTYTAQPGKLEALNARFRDHTLKLFEKHGMKNVIYLTPQNELKENTLIYIISHESVDAAKASFKAFGADPEWIAARDASEKDGKLVLKVDSVYCDPTDYSPIKK